LTVLVREFESAILSAKGTQLVSDWDRVVDFFVQLGVTSPTPGECMCVKEDWGHLPPVHRDHYAFNSTVWMTIQIHGIMPFLRRIALKEALERVPNWMARDYALELIEHFLQNKPDPLWVMESYVSIFSPVTGNVVGYDIEL
jgi:hypothetical protein